MSEKSSPTKPTPTTPQPKIEIIPNSQSQPEPEPESDLSNYRTDVKIEQVPHSGAGGDEPVYKVVVTMTWDSLNKQNICDLLAASMP